MWPSVRRGEESYIFPYQEEADIMFNSALIYEISVLKMYAEPLLYSIREDEPEYQEAKRLLKFMDYFLEFQTTAFQTIPFFGSLSAEEFPPVRKKETWRDK